MKPDTWRAVLAATVMLGCAAVSGPGYAASSGTISVYAEAEKGYRQVPLVTKTPEEWKAQLTAEQYRLTREGGTEAPFSGAYWNNNVSGIYHCVCCGTDVFSSTVKFDAGNGWANFWQPISTANVMTFGGKVQCRRCGAQLGTVHSDGPKPTGARYTVNSRGLTFSAK